MAFVSKIFNLLKSPVAAITNSIRINTAVSRQILLRQIAQDIKQKMPDALALSEYSVYSQNDEDDILRKIFLKINSTKPLTFFEFGVSPDENNTLNLFLNNAKGCWFDKGLSAFKQEHGEKSGLKIFDEFITMENIEELISKGLAFLSASKTDLDLLSFDLDGNDYYFIEKINKAGLLPKVYCLEYNAKFIPPAEVKINYNENHLWQGDDYFGCSLQCYVNLLKENYTLVSCNIIGANCFFVRNDFKHLFTVYSVEDLYQPPRYYLYDKSFKGHPASAKFFLNK